MNHTIECAGWLENSCDDGPGMRSVLFLQGCSKNCSGCHNSGIKEHGKGTEMEIDALINFIESKCCNGKITISGGEPLEQMDSLAVLLEKLKVKGYNICVYTGWELEKVPEKILKLVDYIKTGSFIINLRNSYMQYAGSSNQHMFAVNNGKIKEMSLLA